MKIASSGTSLVTASSPLISWSSLPPLPAGRRHLAVAVLDGLLYAIGGSDATERACANLEGFDSSAGVWMKLPPMAEARSGLIAGTAISNICVAGGLDSNGRALATCEVFDPTAKS